MLRLKNLLIIVWLLPSLAYSSTLSEQRNFFLQAEKNMRQGKYEAFLSDASQLSDYPLYPYLQYQWLQNNLHETEQIKTFLNAHIDTYHANKLRKKWLNDLAKHQQWREYIKQYRADGDLSGECLFYWAHYQIGDTELALTETRRLWTLNNLSAEACKPLFLRFLLSPYATPELIWQGFEQALAANDNPLAKQLHGLLPIQQQPIAERWLRINQNPSLILENSFLPLNHPQAGHLFSYGIGKMIPFDIDKALMVWDRRPREWAIARQDVLNIERKLSLVLAYRYDGRAFQRLMNFTDPDDDVNEWRVRVALKEQNWRHVAQALTRLSNEQKQQPAWRYWQARCLQALGHPEPALQQYRQLANERNFYGLLAATQVNASYMPANRPIIPSPSQMNELLKRPEFQAIRELKYFDRGLDARRLWLFAIDKLDKEQLKIAAKLAEQWQWDQLAIITLAKADYWDDLILRFPIRYPELIGQISDRLQLYPSAILALIRQESLFYEQAYSPAGAIGLMQLLPETARLMARKLNEAPPSSPMLFNAALNLRYGSHYFKQLLERFNHHFVLAIAAYNAGPNRVDKWLPTEQSLPADIWIETIPYHETRKYVANVLFYTLIYQLRTEDNNMPELKNLLATVQGTKN